MPIDKFFDLPTDVFQHWYEQQEKTFKAIANQLKKDLDGFAEQSGINRLALHSVRIKEMNSFLDKITGIRQNDRQDLRADYGASVSPETVIKDLIGARIVFYFSDDLDLIFSFLGTYPQFAVEEVEGYEAITKESPLYRESHRRIADRLRAFPKHRITTKLSAYESYHFQIRYRGKYVQVRRQALRHGKININDFEQLEKFPIEIQVRTILQHTWAQSEHRLNYNIRKRANGVASDDDLLREEFLCHKSILWAAEHHQRVILQHFQMLHPSHREITGPSEDIGVRGQYFKPEDRKRILEIDRVLKTGSPAEVLRQLEEFVASIPAIYSSDDCYILKIIDDVEVWGRQRLILLFLGYLLLTSVDDGVKHQITKLFETNEQLAIQIPWAVCLALYEHIRFLDTHFRERHQATGREKIFFSDPLVSYRTAGAYFGLGNYRRCIYLLDEAVTKKWFDELKMTPSTSAFLNVKHFKRKIGEYYWRAYVTDKRKDHADLRSASEWLLKAIKSKNGPKSKGVFHIEDQKASALAATVFMFRYLAQEPSNKEEFCRAVGGLVNIPDESSIKLDQDGKYRDRDSLLLQGCAIAEFAKGGNRAITLANKALSIAREHQPQDLFVRLVCEEVIHIIQQATVK